MKSLYAAFWLVLPTKNFALLWLNGVPTGTSFLPFPLLLPFVSSPLSHSAYCTTFSIPVFVLFSVIVGLARLSSTLPNVNKSPRSARRFLVSSMLSSDFAFWRMYWPSVCSAEKSDVGAGLAASRRWPYNAPRVVEEERAGSGMREPVSWRRRLNSYIEVSIRSVKVTVVE